MLLLLLLQKIELVWSLSRGKSLRNIVFPAIIDAIVLDPGEDVFYAGGRDRKIYIATVNVVADPNNNYGLHILGFLSEQRFAISMLCYIYICVISLMQTSGFVSSNVVSLFVLHFGCSKKLLNDFLCFTSTTKWFFVVL